MAGDSLACDTCHHPFMLDGSGSCECPVSRRVDQAGECVPCKEHCLHCITESDDSETCLECSSITFLVEGECIGCPIVGCEICSDHENCDTCLVPDEKSILDGLCICHFVYMKPNSAGQCAICDVQGCASCKSDDPNLCDVTIDSTATINGNGLVECPSPEAIDSYGMCSTCQVAGCLECTSGNPN